MKQIVIALLLLSMLSGCAARPLQPFPGEADRGASDTPGGSSDTPGGGETVRLLDYALAQADYPVFPAKPAFPEGSSDWTAYQTALDQYEQDLHALRGEGLLSEEKTILQRFAAASLPLALAGQAGQNAVYSPVSLWAALALLAQCAQGESREQVLAALGAESIDALQDQVSRLWRALYTEDGDSSLLLSNSVWLDSARDGAYIQETLDTLAQKYFAGTYAVPMGTPDADQAVTAWVSEQTHGLIGGGEPVVQTKPETAALLVSSLYYRAGWYSQFYEDANTQDLFTGAGGNETTVDFMHQTTSGSFLRRETYRAASLSTNLGSMTFFLPEEGTTPEDLLRDPALWEDIYAQPDLRRGDIQWSMPKFDVSGRLDLLDTLSRMGITDLLDPDLADLSALTNQSVFLYSAEQMARVKVDEEGVEAAAVTILAVGNTGLPPEPEEICVMDLDHPFLFVIRVSDVPLFVGVVNQAG